MVGLLRVDEQVSSLTGRSPSRRRTSLFQDRYRLMLLTVLPAQTPQFLAFGTGQLARSTLPTVGLIAADPVAPADLTGSGRTRRTALA